MEGTTGGKAPDGYPSVITKEQWTGVLDFVKKIGAKLQVPVSNCDGERPNGGSLDMIQAKNF